VKTVTASFNSVMGQMTEMSQRSKTAWNYFISCCNRKYMLMFGPSGGPAHPYFSLRSHNCFNHILWL